MKELVVARRYARAFFLLTLEQKETAEKLQELRLLREARQKVPTLLKGLSDFNVDIDRRKGALESIAELLGLSGVTVSFLKLLIEKNRINLLPEIGKSFESFQEELERITTAQVIVAEPQSGDEVVKKAGAILKELFGRDAHCEVEVDPKIYGGFVVKVGDIVFDGSVKGHFERMKEELVGGAKHGH